MRHPSRLIVQPVAIVDIFAGLWAIVFALWFGAYGALFFSVAGILFILGWGLWNHVQWARISQAILAGLIALSSLSLFGTQPAAGIFILLAAGFVAWQFAFSKTVKHYFAH
jgi:hypothetical protein